MANRILPVLFTLTSLLFSTSVYAQAGGKGEGRRVLKINEMTKDDKAALYREAAHEKNLELIAMYEETLANPEIEGDKRAELIFRLAEKYFEEGRYFHFQEMEAYQVKFDECFNTKGCDTNKMKPDNKKSRSWQKKAITSYQGVLKD